MSEQEKSEATPSESQPPASDGEAPAAEGGQTPPEAAGPPPPEAEGAEMQEVAPAAAKPPARERPAPPAAREGAAEKPPREIQPAGPPVAIILPKERAPLVSRRTVLRAGFWTSMGAALAGSAACGLNLFWPRGVTGFGGQVAAGDISTFPPGTKTQVTEGRFWIAHLTEEQGGPGLLALWWKCPHLGCTVPWRPTFIWPDPLTGAPKSGWFRCPCHGSTYTDAGIRVFGPAPRSMDTMDLVVEGGRIVVDTGKITPGGPDNASRAVRV